MSTFDDFKNRGVANTPSQVISNATTPSGSTTDSNSSANGTQSTTNTANNGGYNPDVLTQKLDEEETRKQEIAEMRANAKAIFTQADPRESDSVKISRNIITGTSAIIGGASQKLMSKGGKSGRMIGLAGTTIAGTLGTLGDAAAQQMAGGQVDWGQAWTRGFVSAVGGGAISHAGKNMFDKRLATSHLELDKVLTDSKASGKLVTGKINDFKQILKSNPKADMSKLKEELTKIGDDQAAVVGHFKDIKNSSKANLLQKEAMEKIEKGESVDFLKLQKQAEGIKAAQEKMDFRKFLENAGNFSKDELNDLVNKRFADSLDDSAVKEAIRKSHNPSIGKRVKNAIPEAVQNAAVHPAIVGPLSAGGAVYGGAIGNALHNMFNAGVQALPGLLNNLP